MKLNKYTDISEEWLKYKDALRNYILKIVKHPETANSLSHEVLLKVYSSCCSGRDIKNIKSWLFQISYNTCMDYFKKEAKTTELKEGFKVQEENLVYKEAGELIEPLINLLPAKYAKALSLSDIQGLKQQEVANAMGLSLTATKSRIQRARQMLKEQIVECCHVEVDHKGNLTALNVKGSCTPLKKHVENLDNG